MFTHDVKKINEYWKDLITKTEKEITDEFKMDAKDCKPTYPCTFNDSRKRLDDVLFDLTAKYTTFEYNISDGFEVTGCNVRDFKLSEQFNLLACVLEHNDYNDNITYYFQQNFGNLLRNVTGNNILEFAKNLMFTTLEENLNYLQDEVDNYLSHNASDILDAYHGQDYDDRYADDDLDQAI